MLKVILPACAVVLFVAIGVSASVPAGQIDITRLSDEAAAEILGGIGCCPDTDCVTGAALCQSRTTCTVDADCSMGAADCFDSTNSVTCVTRGAGTWGLFCCTAKTRNCRPKKIQDGICGGNGFCNLGVTGSGGNCGGTQPDC